MNCKNVCDLQIADGLKDADCILIMKDGAAYRMTLAEFQSYAASNPNIITDTGLTHAGQAADAKAVGTALTNKLDKILTEAEYGDTLPETGKKGQFFFLKA